MPENPAEKVSDSQNGQPFGRFTIHKLLGQGTNGTVYLAHDPILDRQIALKLPNIHKNPEYAARLLREARSAGGLRHPSIVPIFECGVARKRVFVASQQINGQTLKTRLKSPVDAAQAVDWIRQTALALAYAHDQEIVHRDIKPENIMIDEDNVPQILDFGQAKHLAAADTSQKVGPSILASPHYISPEQAAGRGPVGPPSDQYSLAVILYQMLTGRRPFEGELRDVIRNIAGSDVPPPSQYNAHVNRDLDAICLKALQRSPDQRYLTIQQFADDLDAWLNDRIINARNRGWMERSWNWLQHNRAFAGIMLVLVACAAVVTAILFVSNYQTRNLLHQKKSAAESAERSQREAVSANAIAETNLEKARTASEKVQASIRRVKKLQSEIDRDTAKRKQAIAELSRQNKQKTKVGGKLAKTSEELDDIKRENRKLTDRIRELENHTLSAKYRRKLELAHSQIKNSNWAAADASLEQCEKDKRGWEWNVLRNLVTKQQTTHSFMKTVVGNFEISRDGKYVLSSQAPQPRLLRIELATGTRTEVQLPDHRPDIHKTGDEFVLLTDGLLYRGRTRRTSQLHVFFLNYRKMKLGRMVKFKRNEGFRYLGYTGKFGHVIWEPKGGIRVKTAYPDVKISMVPDELRFYQTCFDKYLVWVWPEGDQTNIEFRTPDGKLVRTRKYNFEGEMEISMDNSNNIVVQNKSAPKENYIWFLGRDGNLNEMPVNFSFRGLISTRLNRMLGVNFDAIEVRELSSATRLFTFSGGKRLNTNYRRFRLAVDSGILYRQADPLQVIDGSRK